MMITNEQMKRGRFQRWHLARKKVAWIEARLAEGYTVQLTTHTRYTRYKPKHAGMFRAPKYGAEVQHGNRWLCIDGCKIDALK